MFGKRFKLFNLLGFNVHVDASWAILAILVTWTLAVGYFPARVEGLGPGRYWLMGAFGAVGLFLSIVLHELSHSLVARRYGIPMHGITLFIFGGVAEMTEEPRHPKSELWTALVGPLASLIIAAGCWGLAELVLQFTEPGAADAVLGYLAFINVVLALFNLIPAFPLDGGRALRAVLWSRKGSLKQATRITSRLGAAFGLVLVFLGVLRFVTGNLVGGVWFAMIGLFLRNAANLSYQQLLVRGILENESVERFMQTDIVTVPASTPLQELINDYFYRYHHKIFPVVDASGGIVGYVTSEHVQRVPAEERSSTSVRDVCASIDNEDTVAPDTPATAALSRMSKSELRRLLVMENGRLAGIVSSRDIVRFLALKMELEESVPDLRG